MVLVGLAEADPFENCKLTCRGAAMSDSDASDDMYGDSDEADDLYGAGSLGETYSESASAAASSSSSSSSADGAAGSSTAPRMYPEPFAGQFDAAAGSGYMVLGRQVRCRGLRLSVLLTVGRDRQSGPCHWYRALACVVCLGPRSGWTALL